MSPALDLIALHQLPIAIAQPTEVCTSNLAASHQQLPVLFTGAGQVGVGMILQQAGRGIVVKKLAAGGAPE